MGLLGGAMDMLGFGNKETSDGGEKKKGLFDSLKFWEKDKEQETSAVTSEIKGELNGMYTNLMLVAKGLDIDTKLDASEFADGMNKEDDSWYEFWDSSEGDVQKVLGDIVAKIKSDPKLATKYADLVSNIDSIKDGNILEEYLGGLTNIPVIGGIIKKAISWISEKIGENETLQKHFKLDKNKVIADVTKDLGLLAQELGGNMVEDEHDHEHNDESHEQLSKDIVLPMKNPIVTSHAHTTRDNGKRKHMARDITPTDPSQKEVVAIADGKVTKIGYSDKEGHYIIITHNINGRKVTTGSVHFNSKPNREEGQIIKAGEYISDMGNTGKGSTGPHLHLTIRVDGKRIDPAQFFDPRDFKYKQNGKIVAFNERSHANDYDLNSRNVA